MKHFIEKHAPNITGTLSGLDRVRFRGTLRMLANVPGMYSYLSSRHILLKNFKAYAKEVTEQIRQSTLKIAEQSGRPKLYLYSGAIRKELRAREIAERDKINSGLICVLDCVEPCRAYYIDKNRETKRLELRLDYSKCLHRYFYFIDPCWGFMHLRLQTWFPFCVQVCINGREWLTREMDSRRMKYRRRENCFTHIANPHRAQELMDAQLETNWSECLNRIEQAVNPIRAQLLPGREYYWSVESSEWATDVMFRSPQALEALYPSLVRHGIQTFSSKDVLRFLGRRTTHSNSTDRYGKFTGEIVSDLGTRVEGVRIKHRVNRNSIKMYDKQRSVLRVETTINNADEFKVYRPMEGDPGGECDWRRLRRGVADMHRRCQLSQAANERYLESLEPVDQSIPVGELARTITSSTTWQGRQVRGLRPLSTDDNALLEVISRGEFIINGFRNRDIRETLYGPCKDHSQRQKQASRVTRLLRLLRAHRLIKKVPRSHRYILTSTGKKVITALIQASQADTKTLKKLAA